MPEVAPNDVVEGFRARWVLIPAIQSIVPVASATVGRAPERTPVPYARLKARETRRERFSGDDYLANFVVDVDVYTETTPPVSKAVMQGLYAAFDGTSTDPSAGVTVPNAVKVLECSAQPGATYRPTTDRIDGIDVVITSASFEVYVQARRG